MQKHKMSFKLLILSISFLLSCDFTTKPNIEFVPYTQRNVGEVKQIIFSDDSSTWLIEVIGKTKRKDGQEVYIVKETKGTSSPDTVYDFIKDGYLVATQLDTIDTLEDTCYTYIPSNPFYEEYLAKVEPKDGDKWIHTKDDDSTFYWIAKRVERFTAICSTFTNVFAFDLFDTSRIILTTYYAQGFDWVGSTTSDSLNLSASCSYMKINGKEIGLLRPAKDVTGNHVLKKKIFKTIQGEYISNLFGRRM